MAGGHGNIWKKRILIPLWVAQLIACVVFLGLSALAMWFWDRVQDDVEDQYPGYAGDIDKAVEYAHTSIKSEGVEH